LRTGQSSILLEQIALAALFHDIGELYQTPKPSARPATMPPCGVTAWHIR
jgi:predicted HD phosphohydrolase